MINLIRMDDLGVPLFSGNPHSPSHLCVQSLGLGLAVEVAGLLPDDLRLFSLADVKKRHLVIGFDPSDLFDMVYVCLCEIWERCLCLAFQSRVALCSVHVRTEKCETLFRHDQWAMKKYQKRSRIASVN